MMANSVSAQVSFNHALGGALYAKSFSITVNGTTYTGAGSAPGITYAPRLNFVSLGDNATLSAGTRIGLGFSMTANSRTGGSGSFVFDLPFLLHFNLGHACNKDSDKNFGFFIGAGYAYNTLAEAGNGYSFGGSSTGPVVDLGVRFAVKGRSFTINTSYMVGMAEYGGSVLSLGAAYNLGMRD